MTTLTRTLIVAATGLLISAGVALARPAVVTTDLNLRAGASTYAPVIIVLPVGATVETHDCSGGWCAVSWRGYEGYASASYLDAPGYAPAPRYYPSPPPPPTSYYDYDYDYYDRRGYRRDYDDRRRARRRRDSDDDRDRRRSRRRDRDDDDRDRRRSRSRDRDDDDRDRRRSRKRGRDNRDDGLSPRNIESLRSRNLYFGPDRDRGRRKDD